MLTCPAGVQMNLFVREISGSCCSTILSLLKRFGVTYLCTVAGGQDESSALWNKMASFPLRVLLYGSAARFQQNVWFRIIFVSDFTLLLTFVGNRRRSFSRITQIPLLTNKSLALFFVLLRKRISLPTWWIFQINLDPDIISGYIKLQFYFILFYYIYIYIIIIIDLNLNRSYFYLNCLRQFTAQPVHYQFSLILVTFFFVCCQHLSWFRMHRFWSSVWCLFVCV